MVSGLMLKSSIRVELGFVCDVRQWSDFFLFFLQVTAQFSPPYIPGSSVTDWPSAQRGFISLGRSLFCSVRLGASAVPF